MVIGDRRGAAYIGWIVAAALGSQACGVESANQNTGGVGEGPGGDCPKGTVVLLSDYVATQVALSNLEGETLSESVLSSGTSGPGLAFPLGGDVTLPSTPPASGHVVLLDRFGTNALTWLDPATGEVLAQLDVDPSDLESNPSDYLELGDGRAYVSRWGHNADPSAEGADQLSDVLVIDTEQPKILDRIPLPSNGDIPPRPSALVPLGEEVLVLLDRVSVDWATTLDSELVALDPETDTIAWTYTVEGHKGCGTPVVSPDGKRFAIACSGRMDSDGIIADLEESALLLFDATKRPLQQVARFSAEEIAGESIQGRVAFASDRLVLLSTQTPYQGETHNRWLSFDLETGTTTELLHAPPDDQGLGRGLVYTSTLCAPGCSDVCLVADSATGMLQRVRLTDSGTLELLEPIRVESKVGMPPRAIAHR